MFSASTRDDLLWGRHSTQAALEAGCDVLIACNNRAGSIAVLEASARHTQGKRNHYLERYLANFTQSSVVFA